MNIPSISLLSLFLGLDLTDSQDVQFEKFASPDVDVAQKAFQFQQSLAEGQESFKAIVKVSKLLLPKVSSM